MLFLVFALVIVTAVLLLIRNNWSKKETVQPSVAVEVKAPQVEIEAVVETVATEQQVADLAVAKEEVKKQKAVVKKEKVTEAVAPAVNQKSTPQPSQKAKKVIKK
jgi:hypothetical protein